MAILRLSTLTLGVSRRSRALGRLGGGGGVRAVMAGLGVLAFAPAAQANGTPTGVHTSDINLTGVINGQFGGGYLLTNNATAIVANATLYNFTTTGGQGSGGGCGCGGVFFVNDGSKLVLSNVVFGGNAAVGGLGNVANSTGGSLNNLEGQFTAGTTAATVGMAGRTFGDTATKFGDGLGNGVAGTDATSGADGLAGQVGAHGGAGGNGGNGWSTNPVLAFQERTDVGTLTADTATLVFDNATEVADQAAKAYQLAQTVHDDATTTKDTAQQTSDSAIETGEVAQATADAATTVSDTAAEADEVAKTAGEIAFAVADGADAAEGFDAPIALTDAAENGAEAAEDGVLATAGGVKEAADAEKEAADAEMVAAETTVVAADSEKVTADAVKQGADEASALSINQKLAADVVAILAQQLLVADDGVTVNHDLLEIQDWQDALQAGQYGNGGAGGAGGNGGDGGFGLGGGIGGIGGIGGTSQGGAAPGYGGAGGDGGAGGFGAGGGAGGEGGANGVNANSGALPTRSGTAGAGGLAGFGGGQGGTGTGFGQLESSGGQGGSGYGGAIFVNAGGVLEIDGGASFSGDRTQAGAATGIDGSSGNSAGSDLFLRSGTKGATMNVDACLGQATFCSNTVTFNGTIADDSVFGIGSNAGSGGFGVGATINVDSGILALNGANSFGGWTYLNGGVLQAVDGVGLPTGTNLIFNGGVLEVPDAGSFTRYLGTGAGQAQWIGSGGFAAIGQDLVVSLNGGLQGAEQLTWGQDGFVGGTNTLMFGTAEATANVHFTNDVQLVGDDHVQVTGNGSTTSGLAYLDGVLSGLGGLHASAVDGGLLFLTAANIYTGETTIDAGAKVSLIGAGAIADSARLTDQGLLDISGASADTSLTTLAGGGEVDLGAHSLTLTAASDIFSGVIQGSGGVHLASGEEVLLGQNGYTGATTIDRAGELVLADTASIASSSGVIDNGLLDIYPTTAGATIKTLSGSGVVYLGAETLSLSKATGAVGGDFSGDILGTGGVHVAGGQEVLSGRNGYTGATTVDAGAELDLAQGGAIALSSRVIDNGVFDISGEPGGASITTLTGSGVVQLGAETLTLTQASNTFAGSINGAGGLTVKGGGEMLTGSNGYTGATDIAAQAALGLSGSGAIAASSGVRDDGLLDISRTTAGASITTLSGSGLVYLGAETLTLTKAADTFAGYVFGTGGLHVGAGAEALTASSTFTGATTIDAGAEIALVKAGAIAASSDVIDNGFLDISVTRGTSLVTLSGSGAVNLGAEALTISNGSTSFAGMIEGTGALHLAAGVQTLAGVNSYTGRTVVDGAAELALAGEGSIATSAGVVDQGVLDISAAQGEASIATLSGQGVVNLGAQTLGLSAAADTFAGVMAGTGGLHVAGGVETLSNANGYTGSTTVDPGATLVLTGQGAIAPSAHVIDDGVFDISATSGGASIVSLAGSGVAELGAQTLTVTGGGDAFSGALNGVGALHVAGGVQRLAGTNGYTGASIIDSGAALALAGTGTISASAGVVDNGLFDISTTTGGASITTLSGAGIANLGAETLTLTTAADTFSGSLVGAGQLEVKGGSETLTGINLYSGATVIDAGAALALAGGGSIASSAEVVDNGVLDISANPGRAAIASLAGSGVVALGAQTLAITAADTAFAGGIDGAGAVQVDGGVQTLSGLNGYTGVTAIDAGATLALVGSGSIAASAGVADAGLLDISATTGGAAITTLAGPGVVALGAETLTLTAAGDTFSGVIAGPGGLHVAGGAEALAGASTYTGATTIDAGAALALTGAGSISLSAAVRDEGLLDISATDGGATITTLSGGGVVGLGAQTLTLSAAADTFSGSIVGSGGVDVSRGVETFSGANGYTGATTVEAGATLALAGSGSIASSSKVIDHGVFDISATSGGTLISTLSGDGTVALGAQTLALSQASDTFSGSLEGTGGLEIDGGAETLTGVNGYTGATSIGSQGALLLAGAGSVASSAKVVVDGTFDISAATGAAITSLSGAGVVKLGSQTLSVTAGSGTFSGAIDGSGGLQVTGGTQVLSGANGYTGVTTVEAGAALALAGTGSIAASSGVVDHGLFDISATTDGATITTLSGDGVVDLGTQRLTVTNASGTFTGVITDPPGGVLAITGGTETLTGANTYTGGTVVSNATLKVTGDAALGLNSAGVTLDNADLVLLKGTSSTRSFTLLNTATIDTNGQASTLAGTIGGSGGLIATGGGALTLSGVNTYAGGTVVTGGATLKVASDTALGASSGALDISNGTLEALGDLVSTRPVLLSGDGLLDANGHDLQFLGGLYKVKDGVATEILNGDATVEGALSVSTDTGYTVMPGATLSGVGYYNLPITVMGTLAPGDDPGTMIVTAPVTLTSQGTLAIDIDGTGTGVGAGNYSRVLVTGAGNSFTAAGTLAPVLRGITGSATNSYTPPVGQSFTIVEAQGGVLGSFASIAQPAGLAAGTRFDSVYGTNAITLFVTPADYTDLSSLGVKLTGNEASVGQGINALRGQAGSRPSAEVETALADIFATQASAIPVVLDQLDGAVYADALRSAAIRTVHYAEIVDGLGVTADPARGHGLWLQGYGQTTSLGSAHSNTTGGIVGGYDQRIRDVLVGVAVGHDEGSLQEVSNGDRAKVDLTHLTAYADASFGAVKAGVQLGGMETDVSADRGLGVVGERAHGSGSDWGFTGAAHLGYEMAVGAWRLTPEASITAASLRDGAIDETKAGALALDLSAGRFDEVQSRLGAELATDYRLGGVVVRPVLDLGWLHELDDRSGHAAGGFAADPSVLMPVVSAADGANALAGSLALQADFGNGLTLSVRGSFDTQSNVQSRAATGTLRWSF